MILAMLFASATKLLQYLPHRNSAPADNNKAEFLWVLIACRQAQCIKCKQVYVGAPVIPFNLLSLGSLSGNVDRATLSRSAGEKRCENPWSARSWRASPSRHIATLAFPSFDLRLLNAMDRKSLRISCGNQQILPFLLKQACVPLWVQPAPNSLS